MPVYSWRCTKCKKEEEIIRSISESGVPPDSLPSMEPLCRDGEWTHSWEKFLAAPPAKRYGANWGTRKGYH